MRIAIVGSRTPPEEFEGACWQYVEELPIDTVIVSGGAIGIDSIAEDCAFWRGMATDVHLPEWDKYGKSAGMIRNSDIVNAADKVVAFWDGKSKGTLNTITKAKQAGKSVEVFKATDEGKL